MNIDLQSLMYAIMEAQKASRLIQHAKETIDEDRRSQELRKGSIDVEFRVIE